MVTSGITQPLSEFQELRRFAFVNHALAVVLVVHCEDPMHQALSKASSMEVGLILNILIESAADHLQDVLF